MKRWGHHTGPQVGQVWEHEGDLWLIVEDIRYGYVEWLLDTFCLTTGERVNWRINNMRTQQGWKQII